MAEFLCFMTIWSILRPIGIFYGHFVHFVVVWYIFPVLVCCTKKNLATLIFFGGKSLSGEFPTFADAVEKTVANKSLRCRLQKQKSSFSRNQNVQK
jgi:hypothetical protein